MPVMVQRLQATKMFKAGALTIEAPWARATPGGAQVAGGFMKITNTGSEPDRLVGGTVPFAGRFEVHEMTMDGGVMKMRELSKGLEIKPGETVELKPGGYHVMFMDLKSRPQGRPDREGHAGVREGRQGRGRISRRSDRRRRPRTAAGIRIIDLVVIPGCMRSVRAPD